MSALLIQGPTVEKILQECDRLKADLIVIGSCAAPQLDAEQSRFLLFDAVASLLRRAAAREPLLLVLEDLHWGG